MYPEFDFMGSSIKELNAQVSLFFTGKELTGNYPCGDKKDVMVSRLFSSD